MISSVNIDINRNNCNLRFGKEYNKDSLLPDTVGAKAEMSINNGVSAFTEFPIKGIRGSKNSNFHEYLTMSTVPYVMGSLSMIGVSAIATNKFKTKDAAHAKNFTKFVALGVIFYGLFKKISDTIINTATRLGTGFDSQRPYVKINYQLKERLTDKDSKCLEYHKIGESVDYPYWSLMYGEGDKLNENFDKFAKRNGLVDNYTDSDQAAKPAIKEILVKSTLAKNIVSYIWAATGVALASQATWENFKFKQLLPPVQKIKDNFKSLETGVALKKSCKDCLTPAKDIGGHLKNASKSLWKDNFGKALIITSLVGSILGSVNSVIIKNKPVKSEKIFDSNKEKVEC